MRVKAIHPILVIEWTLTHVGFASDGFHCADYAEFSTIDKNYLRAMIAVMKASTADELLKAAKFLFGEIESGNLVRDITRDMSPDWPMRMMKFTMELGKAQVAIANAEKEVAE